MSAKQKPSDRLLELLVPLMAQEGFTYRKARHSFEKAFPHGRYAYWVMFSGRGGLVTVDGGFFVHFDALERQFEDVMGRRCPWSAGASLLNAGADPWQFWLFDQQFASLTIKERAAYASEVVHPQERIEAGVQFLLGAYRSVALPFFQRFRTHRDLADFYADFRRSGYTGRCRPLTENVMYLSLLLAASLGDDSEEI